jgi:hypothetical protein
VLAVLDGEVPSDAVNAPRPPADRTGMQWVFADVDAVRTARLGA